MPSPPSASARCSREFISVLAPLSGALEPSDPTSPHLSKAGGQILPSWCLQDSQSLTTWWQPSTSPLGGLQPTRAGDLLEVALPCHWPCCTSLRAIGGSGSVSSWPVHPSNRLGAQVAAERRREVWMFDGGVRIGVSTSSRRAMTATGKHSWKFWSLPQTLRFCLSGYCLLAHGSSLGPSHLSRFDFGYSRYEFESPWVSSLLGRSHDPSPAGGWRLAGLEEPTSTVSGASQVGGIPEFNMFDMLRLCPDWPAFTSGGPWHLHSTGAFLHKAYPTIRALDPET